VAQHGCSLIYIAARKDNRQAGFTEHACERLCHRRAIRFTDDDDARRGTQHIEDILQGIQGVVGQGLFQVGPVLCDQHLHPGMEPAFFLGGCVCLAEFQLNLILDVLDELRETRVAETLGETHNGRRVHIHGVGEGSRGHKRCSPIVAEDEVGNSTIAARQVVVVLSDLLSEHGSPRKGLQPRTGHRGSYQYRLHAEGGYDCTGSGVLEYTNCQIKHYCQAIQNSNQDMAGKCFKVKYSVQ